MIFFIETLGYWYFGKNYFSNLKDFLCIIWNLLTNIDSSFNFVAKLSHWQNLSFNLELRWLFSKYEKSITAQPSTHRWRSYPSKDFFLKDFGCQIIKTIFFWRIWDFESSKVFFLSFLRFSLLHVPLKGVLLLFIQRILHAIPNDDHL